MVLKNYLIEAFEIYSHCNVLPSTLSSCEAKKLTGNAIETGSMTCIRMMVKSKDNFLFFFSLVPDDAYPNKVG